MEITATLVKELREKTGAGMMDCKKALSETKGDFEAAVDFLRKKGLSAAAKKAGRTAADGAIVCTSDASGNTVALEVNCETDFVARNEGFQTFVTDLAKHILAAKPANLDALMTQPFAADKTKTITQLLNEVISKIGENIVIRRFELFPLNGKGTIATYIHAGGKIGVLVEVGTEADAKSEAIQTFAKDVAMHVAAANPQVVSASEISPTLIAKEKEIFLAQLKEDPKNANKPQQVVEKIIEGKIRKFTDDVSLLTQPFVKNPDITVNQLIEETKKKAGAPVTVKRFVRFQLGETAKAAAEAEGNTSH